MLENMLLFLAMTGAQTVGHQFSFSLDCKSMHGKMTYRKTPIKYNYSIKLITLPKPNPNMDIGLFFLNKDRHQAFEEYLAGFYKMFFDDQFDLKNKTTDTTYLDFKSNIGALFDLTYDQEHRKSGTATAADQNTFHPADVDPLTAATVYLVLQRQLVCDRYGRLVFPGDDKNKLHIKGVEGINLRSRILDESVYERQDAIRMVIGPKQHTRTNGVWNPFKPVSHVEDLNLSLDYLTRAIGVAEKAGSLKKIELLVVGTEGITQKDIQNKIDALLKPEEDHQKALPPQRHTALMGGIGLSAGYHYHTRHFMFTLRSGIDHMWGKLRQTGPRAKNADGNPCLGWGLLFGAGIDCKTKSNKAIGIEGGLRFNQLKLPSIEDPAKNKSVWFAAPYAQLNCTMFYEDVLSIGLFSGYMFPREFTIKSTGARILSGTDCKIGGLYSGVRLTQYL
jgi:hypothetical protein